jgi:hypothetical protein
MVRKKRSASWQEQAEALKAEAKKLPCAGDEGAPAKNSIPN